MDLVEPAVDPLNLADNVDLFDLVERGVDPLHLADQVNLFDLVEPTVDLEVRFHFLEPGELYLQLVQSCRPVKSDLCFIKKTVFGS